MAFPSSGLFVALAVLVALPAGATNYSLWIHGRDTSQSSVPGDYANFTVFGGSARTGGVNKKAVNWNGRQRIAGENFRIRDALDCFCTGDNWCYVAAHSAGALQIGYALSLYGQSPRYKKNASPGAGGTCSNTDGTTQTGWNIKWIDVAGGAAGGSELADYGEWAVSDPLTSDLVTTTARGMYNHNNTQGVSTRMYAGSKGKFYSGLLKGQDDEAVAYHSSGGVSGSAGGSWCNPGDWFCNDLTLGTAACEGGRAKWTNHTVAFRDDNEAYGHGTGSDGIVSRVKAHMDSAAQ